MLKSLRELVEARERISIKDPGHLKRWLDATGRRYLIFDALDLVDALSWPSGVDSLMGLVAAYDGHRRSLETGRHERVIDPTLGKEIEVPVFKTEVLELEELDRCIRFLIKLAKEKDGSWMLTNPPL